MCDCNCDDVQQPGDDFLSGKRNDVQVKCPLIIIIFDIAIVKIKLKDMVLC